MKTAIVAFRFLHFRDRALLIALLFTRIILTGLDLAGLALIGLASSLVSNSKSQVSGIAEVILKSMASLGLSNAYAAFGALAIGFFVLKSLASVALNHFVTSFTSTLETRFSLEILQGLLKAGLEPSDLWSEKQIFHGVGSSATSAFGQSLSVMSVVFGEGALLVAISIYLARQDLALFATMAAVFSIFGFGLNKIVSGRAKNLGSLVTVSSIRALEAVDDAIKTTRLSTSPGARQFFAKQFESARWSQAKSAAKVIQLGYTPRYAFETMMMICFGALLVQRGIDGGNLIPASTLSIFIAGAFRIVGSMLPLQGSLTNLQVIDSDSKNAAEMLAYVRKSPSNRGKDQTSFLGPAGVEWTDLSYSYPGSDRPVISMQSFRIEPGSIVGIAGPSGSGKSTFADLLLGLRKPNKGTIEMTPNGLSLSVSYVPQHTHIIHGTFIENCILSERITEDDRRRCLELCSQLSLTELLEKLPQGLDTPIGDGGVGLSGGQAQRIGILRALLQSPNLLILDEATSALDAENSDRVYKLLSELRQDTTVIFIAHKTSAFEIADVVLELANGDLKPRIGK